MCMKKRIDLTIDSELLKKFRDYAETHNVKMSNVVENLISDLLKKEPSHITHVDIHIDNRKHLCEYTG